MRTDTVDADSLKNQKRLEVGSMELRKILEAVERGDITPEEGEKLVSAVLESTGDAQAVRYAKEIVNSQYTLRKEEVVDGDLLVMNSRVRLEGTVKGSVEVVNSNLELAGTVEGNLSGVNSMVSWHGGVVRGDVNLAMCTQTGEENVGGRKHTVDVSVPFLKDLDGAQFLGKDSAKELVLDDDYVGSQIEGAEKVVINGNAQVGSLQCEELVIGGRLDVGKLVCERLSVKKGGAIRAGKLATELCDNFGNVQIEKAIFETLRNYGELEVDKVQVELLQNDGRFTSKVGSFEAVNNTKILVCEIAEIKKLENYGHASFDFLKAKLVENEGEIQARIAEYEKLRGNEIVQR